MFDKKNPGQIIINSKDFEYDNGKNSKVTDLKKVIIPFFLKPLRARVAVF